MIATVDFSTQDEVPRGLPRWDVRLETGRTYQALTIEELRDKAVAEGWELRAPHGRILTLPQL